ncbi:hypothetical protein ACH4E8_06880 [Streptomyces sp. NPDC017979]|uniref:hypothetical protein n=1 Tax=Streptomyces sp. NPDC017979 TaxID=3365024 RepID=UPI00379AA5C8
MPRGEGSAPGAAAAEDTARSDLSVPPLTPPRLPPGALRALKRRLHALYRAAGTPPAARLVALAASHPSGDGITEAAVTRTLGSTDHGSLRDAVALASALAGQAGGDRAAVAAEVQALWLTAEQVRTPPVRTAAEWDAVALGVHPAPGPDATARPSLTEYVERPHDGTLRQRLAHAATARGSVFVLLVGRSATGKTRAAYEAVRATVPDWPVLFPTDADQLTGWIDEDGIDPRTVLWLNETQRYVSGAAGETAARALNDLLDRVAPLVVVGTMWPEHLRRLTGGGRGDVQETFHSRSLIVGRHAAVGVPDTLSADLPETVRAAARDPRLGAAVRAAGAGRRVLQHLTVGPELVRRWKDGPDHWFTAAEHAVLTAAVEARRLGHTSAIPPHLLMHAAASFMDSTARATADDDWFETAIGALTSTADGPSALVADRHEPGVGKADGYRPDDYLEQHVRRARAHLAPPAGFWEAGQWARTGDDAYALGRAAAERHRYAAADALYERAVELGSELARAAWAVLRETTHGPAAAETTAGSSAPAWSALAVAREEADAPGACAAYRRAAELGDAWAWAALARLRDEDGDRAAADAVADEALAAGHPLVWRALGRMRTADPAAAAEAYGRAVAAGDGWAHLGLARLAERTGDHPTAIAHAARAAASGVVAAWAELVRLHWAGGDGDTALGAATSGARAGAAEGWAVLARLRARAGDASGAAAAHREAAALGVTAAWRELALLADADGDTAAAEEAAARAARAGDAEGWTALAAARWSRGDADGAERAADRAARSGDVEAWTALSRAREAAGDPAGAERAADFAADHGSPAAWSALARVRERAGDRDGSRRAVARAVSLGALDAWTALGRVREARGDAPAAERAYHRGATAGDPDAYALLGALYEATARPSEARSAYRTATDAGLPEAWAPLLSVLTPRPPAGTSPTTGLPP